MKVGIKEVGKPVEYIDVQDKYRTDLAKRLIGGGKFSGVQYVTLSSDGYLCLAVDEDGLLKQLPTNFLLQIKSPFWPIQKMVGTVVFIRTKPVTEEGDWDYEVDDLLPSDYITIDTLLKESLQEKIKANFEDCGRGRMKIIPINDIP